jgi:hypothetical protein
MDINDVKGGATLFAQITATAAGLAATAVLLAGPSNALPSNGSLLVPRDIAPGDYWATPTVSDGGYVAVCADYTCEVGAGMIENYGVDGRTMIPIPANAKMVNIEHVTLTPAGV